MRHVAVKSVRTSMVLLGLMIVATVPVARGQQLPTLVDSTASSSDGGFPADVGTSDSESNEFVDLALPAGTAITVADIAAWYAVAPPAPTPDPGPSAADLSSTTARQRQR